MLKGNHSILELLVLCGDDLAQYTLNQPAETYWIPKQQQVPLVL